MLSRRNFITSTIAACLLPKFLFCNNKKSTTLHVQSFPEDEVIPEDLLKYKYFFYISGPFTSMSGSMSGCVLELEEKLKFMGDKDPEYFRKLDCILVDDKQAFSAAVIGQHVPNFNPHIYDFMQRDFNKAFDVAGYKLGKYAADEHGRSPVLPVFEYKGRLSKLIFAREYGSNNT